MPSALLVLGGGSFVSRQVCGPPSGGDLCTQRAGALSEGGLLPPPRWLLPSEKNVFLNHTPFISCRKFNFILWDPHLYRWFVIDQNSMTILALAGDVSLRSLTVTSVPY